jgi:hypothetical protein
MTATMTLWDTDKNEQQMIMLEDADLGSAGPERRHDKPDVAWWSLW